MLHCSAEHVVKLGFDFLPMSVLGKEIPKYSTRHQGNHKKSCASEKSKCNFREVVTY